jgi:ABC-type multidrug transport system ATPase subunit
MDEIRPSISATDVSALPAPSKRAIPSGNTGAARDGGRSASLIDVAGVSKRYGHQAALADISFDIRAGEVLGLIGPNGAGKTTLLEAIAGVLPTDAGEIVSRSEPLRLARRREVMFYLPDGIKPYQDQPVARVLKFFAGVYRCSTGHVADAVAALGLAPVLDKHVQSLSKGYNRRLLLALGLIAPHPLLLMDEPFDGFDLRQSRAIGSVLRQAAANGRALVLAIHQLIDAELVCDRFILLSDGRVRGIGTLADLRARTGLPAASLEEAFLALT